MTKVAIDMESTLADFMPRFLQKVEQDHGDIHSPFDVDDWTWITRWGTDYMDETLANIWREEPHMIPTVEGSLEVTTGELQENVDTVDIVTHHVGVEAEMGAWADTHGIQYDELVSTEKPKPELGYDIYIDDKPTMVENIMDEQMFFLMKQPWNMTHWDHNECHSVGSIREAAIMIINNDRPTV